MSERMDEERDGRRDVIARRREKKYVAQ